MTKTTKTTKPYKPPRVTPPNPKQLEFPNMPPRTIGGHEISSLEFIVTMLLRFEGTPKEAAGICSELSYEAREYVLSRVADEQVGS